MTPFIDLRSDTVTRPTAPMRAAMAAADVGDDVYGDDPTVNKLQSTLAERFGYERGLFFPTGTQSNLAALMSHCGRGDEYLVGQDAHTYRYEQGGAAVLGSIQPQPLENEPDGSISLERIARAIKPRDVHFAPTRLLALENTMGGRVLSQAYVRAATDFAHSRGLRTHLDGARIFNAIVKLGIDAPCAVAGFDSVSICLSKGLGTPAGSVLLGSPSSSAPHTAGARRSAAACARRACSRLRGCTRSSITCSAWRRITTMRNTWRRGFAAWVLRSSRLRPTWSSSRSRAEQVSSLSAHVAGRGVLASIAPLTRLATHLDAPRSKIEAALQVFRDYPGWS